MKTKITSALLLLGAFHALVAVGCAGNVGGGGEALLERESPLEQVDLSDVASAESSCEGLLRSVTSFAVLGETGLIVGVDGDGAPVCIDTVEAVQTELGEVGRVVDAGELSNRYQQTLLHRESQSVGFVRPTNDWGDPDPQPNRPDPQDPPDRAMRTVMSLLGV